MRNLKEILFGLAVTCMAALAVPACVYADDPIDPHNLSDIRNYTGSAEDGKCQASYTISTSENPYTGTVPYGYIVYIYGGSTLTLKNVRIDPSPDNYTTYRHAGIEIRGTGDVTIDLEGENHISGSTPGDPGIYIAENYTLTINSSSNGKLYATGGTGAAGIGSGAGEAGSGYNTAYGTCGNICIRGGSVTATGGTQAAGIGSGYKGTCGTIEINSGTVTAAGRSGGAGIGTGYGVHRPTQKGICGNINISGGTVTATSDGMYSGAAGSGIGCGYEGQCGGITIIRGTIKATGAGNGTAGGSGIGRSDDSSNCQRIQISGVDTRITAVGGAEYGIRGNSTLQLFNSNYNNDDSFVQNFTANPYVYPYPTVTLTGAANSERTGGEATQTVNPFNAPYNQRANKGTMEEVIFTANSGYHFNASAFPINRNGVTATLSSNGISVVVSGGPLADVNLVIPDAVSPSEGDLVNGQAKKTVDKVPVVEGNTYASANDNFAPVTDSKKKAVNKLYLDFSNVSKSDVKPDELKMTVIKGTKFTVNGKLKDKDSGKGDSGKIVKVKVNKKNLTAAVTCSKVGTGTAELTMEDGITYKITFNVQAPKAAKDKKKLTTDPEKNVTYSVKDLFGTDIDAGELTITKDKCKSKSNQATLSGNSVTILPAEKGSVGLRYQYLNKKYGISIKIK